MEILNIISNICSIVGVLTTLFVASKVIKISRSFNKNAGEILSGDGRQIIVKGDAGALASENSVATYNNYSHANIVGELDEPPVLNLKQYPITTIPKKYADGIDPSASNIAFINDSKTFCFSADFIVTPSSSSSNRWIGYSYKDLPMRDWRSFINKGYSLTFTYNSSGTIKELQLEIKNGTSNLYEKKIIPSTEKQKFRLDFKNYSNTIDDWKSIKEICFVFFPDHCIGTSGMIIISDLMIEKI